MSTAVEEGSGASPSPPGRGPSRRALVAAVAAAVVFAVASAVLAVLLAAREGEHGQADVRRAAGEFAEIFVTYDHDEPEAHRDAVLARSTGSFREEYESAFDEGLRELITRLGATSRGFVQDIYLTEVDSGQALAIVVVDIETTSTSGTRSLQDVYMRLTMVSVDGRWLVDDVADLSFAGTARPSDAVTDDTSSTSSSSVP